MLELWAPAKELDAFNVNIVGPIEVVHAFRRLGDDRLFPLEIVERHYELDEQAEFDRAAWKLEFRGLGVWLAW
jgi:hypothetical protein